LCVKYIEKLIQHWTRRAISSGYLEEIPTLDWSPNSPVDFGSDSRASSLGLCVSVNARIDVEAPVVTAARSYLGVTAARQ
jgi:hypothetical protein